MKNFTHKYFLFLIALQLVFTGAIFSHSYEMDPDNNWYLVSTISFQYEKGHPSLPNLDKLNQIPVSLCRTKKGFSGKGQSSCFKTYTIRDLNSRMEPEYFDKSALVAISSQVVKWFHKKDIHGVFVYVNPEQITGRGVDIRSKASNKLTFLIQCMKVGTMRTVSKDSYGKIETINAKKHRNIINSSPISSYDLMQANNLENYVYFLNRHPRRHVELEVGSEDGVGDLGVDFVVHEDKPWRVFGNINNAGPPDLNRWQGAVGYLNTQVTGNDDIMQIDVASDGFHSYHAVNISYDRPFPNDPKWRWQIEGAQTRFLAPQLGFSTDVFTGNTYSAELSVINNFYQNKMLFLDAKVSLQYEFIDVHFDMISLKGRESFVMPTFSFLTSYISKKAKAFLEASFTFPINFMTQVRQSDLDRLGRTDVTKNWQMGELSAFGSYFIDPFLVNEVSLAVGGQTSFTARLIPQFQGILGGLYTVRGYPASVAAGDSTLYSRAEYMFHIPQMLKIRPPMHRSFFGKKGFKLAPSFEGDKADWDLILRLFFDAGRVWNVSGKDVFVEPHGDDTLLGSGFGGEFIFSDNVFIRADYGYALKKVENVSKGSQQFYFSATVMY